MVAERREIGGLKDNGLVGRTSCRGESCFDHGTQAVVPSTQCQHARILVVDAPCKCVMSSTQKLALFSVLVIVPSSDRDEVEMVVGLGAVLLSSLKWF